MRTTDVWYQRELPGGGFVVIEGVAADGIVRARVVVERRSAADRRPGNTPPVIAEAEGPTREVVYAELHRIASDNVAVASHIRRVAK